MPSIAERFFIASLIYLILGLLAQAVTIFDVWLGFNPLAYTAVAATEQTLLIGWLTQLALALVYNRWLSPAEKERTPLSPTANWQPAIAPASLPMVVFVLFNLGLPLVILGQPGLALLGGQWLGAAAAFGGLLQLFAGLVFVYDIWRRRNK